MKSRLILVGCLAVARVLSAQVHIDYDKSVDFTKYKTFNVESGRVVRRLGVRDTSHVFLDRYVKEAVAAALSTKGLQPSADQPDLIITYMAGAREKEEVVRNNTGFYPYYRFYGMYNWWGPQWNNWWVSRYEEGTLIVDMIDAKTDQLVWRGYLVSIINNYNEQKFVEKEVNKALRHFPPKDKKP